MTLLTYPGPVDTATELISNAMAAYYRRQEDDAALHKLRRTIASTAWEPKDQGMRRPPKRRERTEGPETAEGAESAESVEAALHRAALRALCSLRAYQLAVNGITRWVGERLWRRQGLSQSQSIAGLRLTDQSLDLDDFSVPPAPWLHRVFRVAGTLNHTGTRRSLLFRVNDLLYEWLPQYGKARGLPLDNRAALQIRDYYGKAFLRPPPGKSAGRDTAGRGAPHHPRRSRREVHHG